MDNKIVCKCTNQIEIRNGSKDRYVANVSNRTMLLLLKYKWYDPNVDDYIIVSTKFYNRLMPTLIIYRRTECACYRCMADIIPFQSIQGLSEYFRPMKKNLFEEAVKFNIIAEYIIYEIVDDELLDKLILCIFSFFLENKENLYYSEVKPEIDKIVQYMVFCKAEYGNTIMKEDVIFTKEIFDGIKKKVKQFFGNNNSLYSIAKMNMLFLELETKLFPE